MVNSFTLTDLTETSVGLFWMTRLEVILLTQMERGIMSVLPIPAYSITCSVPSSSEGTINVC